MRTRLMLPISIGLLLLAQSAAAQYYAQHNLVSDQPGVADFVDSHLVNAWGLAQSPTSPWWIAYNQTGTSTLHDGTGAPRALVVTFTTPSGAQAFVTGDVFNGGTGFVVHSGAAAGPARFIFASEDGIIFGWNPNVPAPGSTRGTVASDQSGRGAVYKGLAIAATAVDGFLYATDFHNGAVDVFDSSFNHVLQGSFRDPALPAGYAPFGIQNIGGKIYVTYALQDADVHDDVAGVGHGFVDAYDLAGNLLQRVASRGRLNSPWGLAVAPATFGAFSGDLLVGNFGDEKINAYDLGATRVGGELQQRGQLHSPTGAPLRIDGLWALQFGNGVNAGSSSDTLFFTAGPDNESHGLFGTIKPTTPPIE